MVTKADKVFTDVSENFNGETKATSSLIKKHKLDRTSGFLILPSRSIGYLTDIHHHPQGGRNYFLCPDESKTLYF